MAAAAAKQRAACCLGAAPHLSGLGVWRMTLLHLLAGYMPVRVQFASMHHMNHQASDGGISRCCLLRY
jgi:hypothetical protein